MSTASQNWVVRLLYGLIIDILFIQIILRKTKPHDSSLSPKDERNILRVVLRKGVQCHLAVWPTLAKSLYVAKTASADLHGRLRASGEDEQAKNTLTFPGSTASTGGWLGEEPQALDGAAAHGLLARINKAMAKIQSQHPRLQYVRRCATNV